MSALGYAPIYHPARNRGPRGPAVRRHPIPPSAPLKSGGGLTEPVGDSDAD